MKNVQRVLIGLVALFAFVGVAQAASPDLASSAQQWFTRAVLDLTRGGTINGDLTVSGDAGVTGNVSIGGTLAVSGDAGVAGAFSPGSINLTAAATNALYTGTTQKVCFGAAGSQCLVYGGANVIQTDTGVGFASLGTLQAQGNADIRGDLRNVGTGANCTGATGSVCVNDTGGFAVADGSGTTVASISNAGKAVVANVAVTAATDFGTITLSAGTGTATVRSGARCICTDSTAANNFKCSVSGTTLTATGTGSDVIVYFCPTSS